MNHRASMSLALSLVLSQMISTDAGAQSPPHRSWGRIHAGNAFSFETPAGTKGVPLQGIDSYVGGYVANGFSFGFDYGPWSNDLPGATAWDRIDGRPSRYEHRSTPSCAAFPGDDIDGKIEASLYVARSPAVALNLHGCARDPEGLADLQRVFRSIRFGPGE